MGELLRNLPHPFPDDRFPEGMGGVVQRTVANGELPALIVIHDDDNDWLIGDGINDPNSYEASGLFHLRHIIDQDPSIEATASLPIGYVAWRGSPGEDWTVEKFDYAEEHNNE
jgi:hypothetical protein